jgi:hypothetical protein
MKKTSFGAFAWLAFIQFDAKHLSSSRKQERSGFPF